MTSPSLQKVPVAERAASRIDGLPVEAGLSPDEIRSAFRNHPAGVAVITAEAPDGPVGLTATSVFSVCAEPPLLAFSLAQGSYTGQALAQVDTLVIHLLGAAQVDIAKLFSSKGVDRFADSSRWARLPTGEPYLLDAPVWIRARVVERLKLQVGGSVVVACHALQAHLAPGQAYEPLVYHDRAWHSISQQSKLPA
jgi:flavin reductase (DIM6/NTAB) family NADH-FMN oxidoreductase RutF